MGPHDVNASNRRWRRNFALLAATVPPTVALLFVRQQRALDALLDHGVQAEAVVTGFHEPSKTTDYSYMFAGAEHSWNVSRDEAPRERGASFAVTVLPERPSFSRPGFPFTGAARAEERASGILYGLPLGLFAFFAGASLLCHRGVVRAQRGLLARGVPLTPRQVGLTVAAVMFAIPLAVVNLDPGSEKVVGELFGNSARICPLVTVVLAVLGAPVFALFPALLELVLSHRRRGGIVSRWGVLVSVVQADRGQRREQRIVLVTGAYFAALLAAWIAYAAWRGV